MTRKAVVALILCLGLSVLAGCSSEQLPEEFTQAYTAAYEAESVSYSGESTFSGAGETVTNQIQYYACEDQSMYITSNANAQGDLTIFTLGDQQYAKSSTEDAWTQVESPSDYTPPWQQSTLEEICEGTVSTDWESQDGIITVTLTYEDRTAVYTVAGGSLMTAEITTTLYTSQQDGSVSPVDYRSVYQLHNSDGEAVRKIIEANLPPEGFS